jgi:hypothetical protein
MTRKSVIGALALSLFFLLEEIVVVELMASVEIWNANAKP